MSQVKNGDAVKVHYTGRLTDGTVFDSSEGREPLGFQAGAGQMIKGFDAAVIGMAIGDKKTVNIPAAEAYGERNPDAILEFPKSSLPEEIKPELGMKLFAQSPNGQPMQVTVVEITDENIKVDANHELAGKELVFDIEMVSINE
ncbi:FKBP-type peptidyl-prolyl cis-trans isomerase [Aureibacter tunicatorum]|uniref:Peptidyl-prolyl cis-trans isomerase n=1 Tax=Aureibacter tunicatorum TaxID=866807 RepID=A0AAE3XGQ2_9BACT|nr:peptidylprolyl isomerase [Aureibacter tunicatorum]MDR6237306.1 peptidylprolyl isomerase [Aureibacter tunicatorum]BDD06297.1 peptidyl-prolyl cis-trans isomerase [Aureibacter tunicatorum]